MGILTHPETLKEALDKIDELGGEIGKLKAGINEVRKDLTVGRLPSAITSLRELEEDLGEQKEE
jgi:hypothetical protein